MDKRRSIRMSSAGLAVSRTTGAVCFPVCPQQRTFRSGPRWVGCSGAGFACEIYRHAVRCPSIGLRPSLFSC